jgi:methyltransferase
VPNFEASRLMFIVLLLAVAGSRMLELRLSRRNRKALASKGAAPIPEKRFCLMVVLHAGVLFGAAAEVLLLRRPLLPGIALGASLVFSMALALRFWVIRTLAEHWNAQVMDSTSIGIVTAGPYRWVRHPNYLAVFLELLALPMIHTAWITATSAAVMHVFILRQRIRVEESVLMRSTAYRAIMSPKARFLPGLF